MLKRVKTHLKQDTDHVRRFNTSDSDSICSRTLSMDSEGQLSGLTYGSKIPKASSSGVTIEEEYEEATSSADETDDELTLLYDICKHLDICTCNRVTVSSSVYVVAHDIRVLLKTIT